MTHSLKLIFFIIMLMAYTNSDVLRAASTRELAEKNEEEERPVFFLGAEGVGAPLGDGKAYVVKGGLDGGVRLSKALSLTVQFNWMRYIAEDSDEDIQPGTVQPGRDTTHWDNVLSGSKTSLHCEYYPPFLREFFYVAAGPAFQSERYRAENIEIWPAAIGESKTKFSSFGYNASTIGIETGVGARIFPEGRKYYAGVGVFEHYRPLKRASYKGIGVRPTLLENQRLESPDSVRYKILSLKFGAVF